MLVNADNSFNMSHSPHSLGLSHSLTVPMPGWDSNANLIREKLWLGAGMGGFHSQPNEPNYPRQTHPGEGFGGLNFDGTGLFGTGLFSGDVTTWGVSEVVFGLIGVYAIYSMFFQAKQTNIRLQASAHRRRKSKVGKLREKAKKLEEQEVGGWF